MPTTSARLSEFAQEDQQYNGNQFVQTFGGLVYILGLPSAARGRAPSDLVVSRLQYAQWISVYIIQIPSSRGWHGLTGDTSFRKPLTANIISKCTAEPTKISR